MPDRPAPRGRPLAVGALVIYIATLALAAWVEPLRPHALDGPYQLARRALLVFGVRPGIAVFRQESDAPVKDRNACIRIRGHRSDGSTDSLWPADGRCADVGIRLRMNEFDQAQELMLRQAKYHQLRAGSGRRSAHQAFWRDRPLARLAESWCTRRPDLARLDVAWTIELVDMRSARVISGEYLVYAYACDTHALLEQHWLPRPEEVEAFWGGDPWAE